MTAIEMGIISIILLIVGVLGYSGYVETTASSKCLHRGYPTAQVTFTLQTYCIKRVNQTDSVARLKDLP